MDFSIEDEFVAKAPVSVSVPQDINRLLLIENRIRWKDPEEQMEKFEEWLEEKGWTSIDLDFIELDYQIPY